MPFPSLGDLPDPGIKPRSPALESDALPSEPQGKEPIDGQYLNQTDYILCSQRWRSSIESAKTRLGADCGSYHELLIAKLRLKLKKVGKTTRPLRYDLNQIPYDYTVEVANRFKGLNLMEECLKTYGWRFMTLYRMQGSRLSPTKEIQKGKIVV